MIKQMKTLSTLTGTSSSGLDSYRLINPTRRPTIYEIIKTEDQHIVLVHDNQTPQTVNDEADNRVIRRFTTENPVIPDDVFMSPISETDSS